MRDFFEELKRFVVPLLIISLIISIVLGGALTKSITDANDANVDSVLIEVLSTVFSNITNFAFFGGIFVDFLLFLKITFWTIVVVFGIYVVAKIQSKNDNPYKDKESGSSAWSKDGEEFRITGGKEILNRKEGFILSKKHYLGTDLKKVAINKNILVVGGSGAGKSACYIKPNIYQCLGSYVITDPKGELYKETSKYLIEQGYEVKTFNLVDPRFSDFYNPFANIENDQDVDTLAHILVTGAKKEGGGSNDPFWDDTAKMLISATIYYVLSVLPIEEQNIGSCMNIIRQGGSDSSIFEKLFIEELKPQHPGRKQYESFKTAADKTMQSIIISSISKMRTFDMPAIQNITSSNSINFRTVAKKKTAIFVITSAAESTYDFVSTMFFSQMLSILYSQADRNGGKLPNQVYFLLDEFANIGQIPDFQKKLSTTRSLGISISIVVQSLDQLESLYKDSYENIMGNCDTHLFLGSNSQKTCEYFSKSLGQTTIKIEQKSVSKDKSEQQKQGVSISTQRQARDLMTVDELRRMDNNFELIMVRGLKPIKVEKAWYFKYHPKRNIVENYRINNESEMPTPEPIPFGFMNVKNHFTERQKRAQEVLKSRSQSVDIDTSTLGKDERNKEKPKQDYGSDINIDITSNNDKPYESKEFDPITEVPKKNQVKSEFDLQKELESKFDKLFGNTKKNTD